MTLHELFEKNVIYSQVGSEAWVGFPGTSKIGLTFSPYTTI